MSKFTRIPLSQITSTHNPRCPARALAAGLLAAGLYPGKLPIQLVHELALSTDPAKQAEFVALVEKYESGPQGIVELAKSRRQEEAQPIMLRDFRVKTKEVDAEGKPVYVTHYGVVLGERRLLAGAYNHAKHGDPADIGADVRKLTLIEADDIAFDENHQRQQMTDLEVGAWLRKKFEAVREEKKASGQRYTLKEWAADRNEDYQYLRSRVALTYLPDNLKAKLESGKLGLTEAARIGQAIKSNKPITKPVKDKSDTRVRVTLGGVQLQFDTQVVKANTSDDYLEALADLMEVSLRQAKVDSTERRKQAEVKAANAALGGPRRGRPRKSHAA